MAYTISEEAKQFLKAKDPYMKALLKYGNKPYEQSIDDPFQAMVDIIIGQQISEKAKESIVKRLYERCGPVTQTHFKTLSIETMREVGLSKMKAETIKRLANMEALKDLPNQPIETIDKTLLNVKGVGKWSVEMFHFVCLQSPHIFSLKDIGIVNGLKKLYRLNKDADLEHFKTYYHPHESAAASYIWMVLELDKATLNKIYEEVDNNEHHNI